MTSRTKSPALEKPSRTGHPKFRILTQSGRTGVVLERGAETIPGIAKGRATRPIVGLLTTLVVSEVEALVDEYNAFVAGECQ
jgi:hypothetical protein